MKDKDKEKKQESQEPIEKEKKDKDKDKEAGAFSSESDILEKLEKKEKEYASLWDRYLRLQAEFDNYKKRTFKEKVEFVKFANEGLILELLDILDNFERGVKSAELKKDFGLLHQGVDMISKQLHTLLEAKGLKRIKSLGENFDPHQHEAVEVIEDEDEEASEGRIVEELQPGYMLNDRIIRPAKVKVVRKKEKVTKKEVEKQETIEKPGEEIKD